MRDPRRVHRTASILVWAKVTIAYAWTAVLCWAVVRLVLWVTA